MISIRGLDHVVVRCRDLDRMLGFYRDVLGCPVERELPREIGLVQLRAGAALIDLVPAEGAIGRAGGPPPQPSGGNMDHFCLSVDPFDEAKLREYLGGCGVEVGEVAERYGATGTGPSLYLKDPEGNTVELKGPSA